MAHGERFTYQSRSAFTSASRQLQQLGIEPRVEAVVESFLALPSFIAGSNRLGLLQRGLAPLAERTEGVRVLEPPFEGPLRRPARRRPSA